MPIPIQCQECQRTYKVDDKLAGKMVKCKGCGAFIRVVAVQEVPQDQTQDCLSCGKPMPAGIRVCGNCGFNSQTGQKELLLLAEDPEEIRKRKNRRWVRPAGNPLLQGLDRLAKVILFLLFLGGLTMTVLHTINSPEGFTFFTILPTLIVLLGIIAVMAPLASMAVKLTVRTMKLPPRDDTYSRIVLCLLAPFAAGMIGGWPEMAEWNWVASFGWPLGALLLIYLLRAELMEWLASLVAAAVSAGLSLIVVCLVAVAVDSLVRGMYADMLPEGPWAGLAKGHSPLPPATKPAPPTIAETRPTPATIVSTTPDTATAPIASTATSPIIATTDPTTPTTMVSTAPVTPTTAVASLVPVKMTSALFTSVIDNPAIADAAALVAPVAPADWMLTVKIADTTTEVDRWSLSPLTKKEHHSYPFVVGKSPQFAISPKGDAFAALTFFPRRSLEILAYDARDTRISQVSIPLDAPANVPNGATQAMPVLLGVLDPNHYFVRWDHNGMSAAQIFTGPAIGAAVPPWRWTTLDPSSDTSPPLLSPNAKLTAVFGRNQITFGTLDGTTPPPPIIIASDTNVRVLGMTFSSDSSQIAVYAAIADLPTIAAYQVRGGTPVFTSLLASTPLDKKAAFIPHALVWLPGAQSYLINGNDLMDATTGKKFASLGLSGVSDAQMLGPSMLGLTFQTATGPHTILAKLDDEKIRAAKPK